MGEILFDIYYKGIKNKEGVIKGVNKENVEFELDKTFKNEGVILATVTKHSDLKPIFYHSVFSGTFIIDKDYKGSSITKNGTIIMKLTRDCLRPVKSKYPRWDYHRLEHYDGELNIEELLGNIK